MDLVTDFGVVVDFIHALFGQEDAVSGDAGTDLVGNGLGDVDVEALDLLAGLFASLTIAALKTRLSDSNNSPNYSSFFTFSNGPAVRIEV